MSDPIAIVVPREIVNADSVYLVAWRVDDGARVDAGSPVCEIETSKAVEVLEAPEAGFVRHCVAVGGEVPIGGVLGYISERADAPLPAAATPDPDSVERADVQISAKARKKMEELGLDPGLFAGRGIVRERDVLDLGEQIRAARTVDPRGPFRLEPLGPIQRRVARLLEQSVARTPGASLDRIVDLGPVRERARRVARESNAVVTEVDLLASAVARACIRFPHFNCFVTSDDQLHVFERANVAVAVDVEGDLYVVTVADAGAKSPVEIAKEMRSLQYLAARRRLTAAQTAGGTITITSMLGRGVHRFRPIPYPHQAAIVGLSDCEPGTTRSVLTLVFDHRVANGAEAAAFLGAIDAGLRE